MLKKIIHACIAETKDISQADVNVSNGIKRYFAEHPEYKKFCFYSEEDQTSNIRLPLILLDPIDGTNEFVKGSDECAVSFSMLYSYDLHDVRNTHWIYNFRNQSEILYHDGHISMHKGVFKYQQALKYRTVISRTEYKKYQLENLDIACLDINPVGSIAYKLALLAMGGCDFVISLHNKHAWDIAAGSMILCLQGVDFFECGEKQSVLEHRLYQGPLVWVGRDRYDELAPMINKLLQVR